MPETRGATTFSVPFSEVVSRLSRQPIVDGLLVVGSAAQGDLTMASDYDLVVVLSEMPVPLHVGTTYIEGRFTDLIFHTVGQVEQILVATAPIPFAEWTGRLVGWLERGQIVFDRRGRLRDAQRKAQANCLIIDHTVYDDYKAWQRINYNLHVARRYLSSRDPLYLMTGEIRMSLYGPGDLLFSYFQLRRVRWEGEKAAVRYLQAHNPDYLALFRQFLQETGRDEKFRLYEVLATKTLAPVGKLWKEGETTMILDADTVTPEMEAQALDFWEALTTGKER